jgi:hypothetical protein
LPSPVRIENHFGCLSAPATHARALDIAKRYRFFGCLPGCLRAFDLYFIHLLLHSMFDLMLLFASLRAMTPLTA